MEQQTIAEILGQYAAQLSNLSNRAADATGGEADISALLNSLWLQQEAINFQIRSLLELYTAGNAELTEHLRRRLFEIDLETLLCQQNIPKRAF